MDKESVLKVLSGIKYPPYERDIVSFGMVKYVKVEDGKGIVKIYTGNENDTSKSIVEQAKALLEEHFLKADFTVELMKENPAKAAEDVAKKHMEDARKNALKNVKIKIAIASGKGGVGKSTASVNLARAFEKIFPCVDGEARVGLMDCDVHGPSATILMKKEYPSVDENQKIIPPQIGGIKAISMGMLIDDSQPVIWRGPMVSSALKQFTDGVKWGELDIMIFDLPPGTGDAVLSVVQGIPLDGAVIVTTPNTLAATTARRGAMIFEKTDIKIIGVIDNMAYLEMPDGSKNRIFGEGGAAEVAKALNTQVLADVPIDPSLQTDKPSEKSADIFESIAQKILEAVRK